VTLIVLVIHTLFAGAFARVCFCLHRPSSQYLALKMLPNNEVGSGRVKQVEHVRCEMQILKVSKTGR
jgi:hypothetical protein